MEKIQSGVFTEAFKVKGALWNLDCYYGDILLFQPGNDEFYGMERKASSIVQPYLIRSALQGSNPQVAFSLDLGPQPDSYYLMITTPAEELKYLFKLIQLESTNALKREIWNTKKCFEKWEWIFPIAGCVKPRTWKEYGLRSFLVDIDYSYLGLKKAPILMTYLVGQAGYTAIKEKTNKACKVFVNFTEIDYSFIKNPELKVSYCLVPQEEVAPLPPLKTYRAVWKAVRDGRELAVFEDKVLDLKLFSSRHPGGHIPIRSSYGHEIGRYVYGGYKQQRHLHAHTADAIGLIKKYEVDTIEDPLREALYLGIAPGKSTHNYVFRRTEANGVTDIHTMLSFANPEVRFRPAIGNIRDYGKYFAVNVVNEGVVRNFACTFSFYQDILSAHTQLMKAVDEKKECHAAFEEIDKLEFDYVNIVVEQKGDLSKFLAVDSAEMLPVILKGPYGSGVDLDANQKGTVAVIIDETGMLLLLDLFMYMIRLNAFLIGQKTGISYEVFANEEFKDLRDPSFKLMVFGYFHSKFHIPYYQVLKTLQKWEEAYGLRNFVLHEHFFEPGEEPLTKEEFETKLPRDTSKVIMFGHNALLLHCKLLLTRFGLPDDLFLKL